MTIAESPHRGHHQLVTPEHHTHHQHIARDNSRVNGPGPDGQSAEVGAARVHNGFIHVIPEAHAPRPPAPVHLLAHEEGPVPGLLDVVVAEVHVEAALVAGGVVPHWEPHPVHLGALPLPLDLVHGVPLAGVLPPALVILEAAVTRAGGGNLFFLELQNDEILSRLVNYLGCSWTDSRGNRDIVNGNISQSISPDNTLKHDLN